MATAYGLHLLARTMSTSEHIASPCFLVGRERTSVTVERVRPQSALIEFAIQSNTHTVIMPPSALASITQMDLEPPWMFKLRNPENPAASTHAGVLEFIAEEGCVHLPQWMMKTLRLDEGDAIRVTGAELPKGQFVKLQAQSTMFLEISDPKAVYVMHASLGPIPFLTTVPTVWSKHYATSLP